MRNGCRVDKDVDVTLSDSQFGNVSPINLDGPRRCFIVRGFRSASITHTSYKVRALSGQCFPTSTKHCSETEPHLDLFISKLH